ncbi:hypothetical protein NFI96_030681 [Prochilodus magdalenae]|nr:hypothetical protein NFI96_030681 [Prochilodus magdalenae]
MIPKIILFNYKDYNVVNKVTNCGNARHVSSKTVTKITDGACTPLQTRHLRLHKEQYQLQKYVAYRVGSFFGYTLTGKGCANSEECKALEDAGKAKCCQTDLCNGAEGVKLSLLIMLVPLISSILFL